MSSDAGGTDDRAQNAPPGSEAARKIAIGRRFAAAAARRPPDRGAPPPDLLTVLNEQQAFIEERYPEAMPSETGAERLDEFARIRELRIKRLVDLEMADRVTSIVMKLLASAASTVAIVLLGHRFGPW